MKEKKIDGKNLDTALVFIKGYKKLQAMPLAIKLKSVEKNYVGLLYFKVILATLIDMPKK